MCERSWSGKSARKECGGCCDENGRLFSKKMGERTSRGRGSPLVHTGRLHRHGKNMYELKLLVGIVRALFFDTHASTAE